MSYEIFTSIKYNKTTRNFDCASYSNNVWPKIPNKWTMDYFAKLWPNATEQELKAGLILAGIYSGDKYYTSIKWANEYKNIAKIWVAEQEQNGSFDYQSYENARALAEYYAEYIKAPKQKFVIVGAWGDYVTKINKTSYSRCRDKTQAKIFEARTERELLADYDIKWLVDSGSYRIATI